MASIVALTPDPVIPGTLGSVVGRRSGGRLLAAAAAATLLTGALTAAPALAVAPPTANGALADSDRRAGDVASVPASSRRARRALDARLGSNGFVETDRLTGGVYRAGRSDGFLTGASKADPAAIVLDFLRSRPVAFDLDAEDVDRLSLDYRYVSFEGVTHLYFVQASRGVPAYDTGVDAHVTQDGRIVSISARAVPGFAVASGSAAISAGEALAEAKRNVRGDTRAPSARTRQNAERETFFSNGDRASLVVLADPNGEDDLGWKVIAGGADGILYEVVVNARSGSVVARRSLTDFMANASVYDNYPGAPGGGSAVTFDLEAPESGAWTAFAGTPRTKLDGNNVHAYADVNDNDIAGPTEEVPANDGVNWIYARAPFTQAGCPPVGCSWNSTNTATRATNKNQVTTEVFYLINRFHDWLLAPPVGFDEASRNFEQVNSSAQGLGNDRVRAEVNDGADLNDPNHENNANFATPPDGFAPRMQMYFTSVGGQSMNTGDDASVVLHEYTHGLTNRLVGNGFGLTALQSRAMGEGWSDWYALDYLVANDFEADTSAPAELKTARHSFPPNGVRTEGTDCPIGASAASCPGTAAAGAGGYTFGDLGKIGPPGKVHGNGEIWAQTLWDLRSRLGSSVARGLVTGGLRLSPNAPSYLTMRDSILQADQTIYAGAHYDTVWQVFAARGMGFYASTPGAGTEIGNEDFSLPPIQSPPGSGVGGTGGGGGGGGDGMGTSGAADGTVSPRLTFSKRGPISVSSRGAFRFSFLASPVGTTGTATFDSANAVASAKKKRKLRLGRKSFTAPTNGQVKLKLKLSEKNLAVLRKRKRLSTVVKVQFGASSLTKTFSLKAPKRKRR